MRRVCAWCGKEMDAEEAAGGAAPPITHGICDPCSDALWGNVGTPIERFLESLGIPTLLVTGDVVVEGANLLAREMVGPTQDSLAGKFGGEVFDCVNATLPGGCGQTVHCSACTLRRTVTETHTTGESQLRVPATLKIHPEGLTQEIVFYVTTEKVGDRVLIQIEPAEPEA